jgi:hypothetical protein
MAKRIDGDSPKTYGDSKQKITRELVIDQFILQSQLQRAQSDRERDELTKKLLYINTKISCVDPREFQLARLEFNRRMLERPLSNVDTCKGGPPHFGMYLLHYLPKDKREAIVGDLVEEFGQIEETYGIRKARLWFYYQIVASFWPLLFTGIKRLLGAALVGNALEWLRRLRQ